MSGSAPTINVRFVIVNSFTSANLLTGVFAVIAASSGAMTVAAWGLLLCVVFDALDGLLARRWQITTPFGAQLDSLADMTSFITAGAALIFFWTFSTIPLPVGISVTALYALAGAIRLARFGTTIYHHSYFQGIPTTFVASVIATNYLLYPSLNSFWIMALVSLLAIGMVSLLPYPKIAMLARRCPRWCWIVVALCACINLAWTVWFMCAIYMALGPAIALHRRYIAR